jgi:hypothetical protein
VKPSQHPASCTGCRGTGYTDGPDEWETVAGQPHRYTTVTPCRHEWHFDEPAYPDEPREPRHA